MTYLAIAPNYWGKGDSVDAAKKTLKNAGGSLVRYLVYRMPDHAEDVWVDQMGSIRWTWAEGHVPDDLAPVELEIVTRRGIQP